MVVLNEIIVIGAGIGGLATALSLRKRNINVRVIEQAEKLLDVGAGVQISANGFRVLSALGVGAKIFTCAVQARSVELIDHKTAQKVRVLNLEKFNKSLKHFFLHRADLINVLFDACVKSGVLFSFGERVLSVSNDHKPEIVTSSGSYVPSLVVCADGVNSIGRASLLGPVAPSFTGYVAWRALIPNKTNHADVAKIYMGPKKHVVSYPIRDRSLINLVLIEERNSWTKEGWSHKGDAENLRESFCAFNFGIGDLLSQVQEPYLWGLFRHPVAEKWYADGIVLLGDAAHPTLPFMAQGANLALEDAWILARCLSEASMPEKGMQNYQEKRKNRVERIISVAERNAWKYHLSFPPLKWAAHKSMWAMSKVVPNRMVRHFDWIYRYDVTVEG